MYNKKSDYAINKRNPDAIVYTDADKNEIKLTRDDFESEEEFLRWKAWSDAEYKQAEKNGRGYYDHTVALIDDADTYGETLEDELFALADKLEHDEKCAAMVAQIREVLTETQFRVCGFTVCAENPNRRLPTWKVSHSKVFPFPSATRKRKFQKFSVSTKKHLVKRPDFLCLVKDAIPRSSH